MKKDIDIVMKQVPEVFRYRWCSARMCACLGCVNDQIIRAGLTKLDWEAWVDRHLENAPVEIKYEKLLEENARYREALEKIGYQLPEGLNQAHEIVRHYIDLAREALEGGK